MDGWLLPARDADGGLVDVPEVAEDGGDWAAEPLGDTKNNSRVEKLLVILYWLLLELGCEKKVGWFQIQKFYYHHIMHETK